MIFIAVSPRGNRNNEEELSLWMRVKGDSERVNLKLNIKKKAKIIAPVFWSSDRSS
jgi:hypothetical protein